VALVIASEEGRGPARGELADSLEELARIHEERFDTRWRLVQALAPPIIIAAVGVLVTAPFTATYLPAMKTLIDTIRNL